MASRLDLQSELESISGVQKVYFQPPESVKLKYPCVVYEFSDYSVSYADDLKYRLQKCYEVTVIDKNPDSTIPDELFNRFKQIHFNNRFVNENLEHWVFKLYY